MKKTCNMIVGGVVAIGILAAIGAITVARYAAKQVNKVDMPDDCECDGDCEHCPMNDPDVEVELEVKPTEENAETAEPAAAVENVTEEVPAEENTEA